MPHIIDSEMSEEEENQLNINDIPSEVFKYILSHLSHYNDLLVCKLVCKYWYDSVISTLETRARKFKASLRSSNIEWYHYYPLDVPHISARYSHSCCLHSNLMYIFGGCNSGKTTFNDLWTFDLSQRQWIRPLASGCYPPPKACCSLVAYKNKLILFGGWTHSSSNRIHDSWKLFNHLHEFDTRTEKWSLIELRNECPAIAGHNASIYGDEMIVFGGLQSLENAPYNYIPTNDIYVFNLLTHQWRKQPTSLLKPPARYGHSQMVLNDHLVILGGSNGPKKFLNDIWVLDLRSDPWNWCPVTITNDESTEQPIIGTNPVCKVDDMVVLLSKSQGAKNFTSLDVNSVVRKVLDRHNNELNGAAHRSRHRLQPQPSQLERRKLMSSGHYSVQPSENEDQKFLKSKFATSSVEETHRKSVIPIKLSTQKSHFSPHFHDALCLFTLDISRIITEKKVSWLPQENYVPGPQELLLYSLVLGDSEIIMFGGVRLDNGPTADSTVSNSIYIVSCINYIVADSEQIDKNISMYQDGALSTEFNLKCFIKRSTSPISIGTYKS